MPRPLEVIPGRGQFHLDGRTSITTAPELEPTARYLQELIHTRTGLSLNLDQGQRAGGSSIRIELASTVAEPDLGREGYRLAVNPGQMTIHSPKPAGAFYAIQTLRQLIAQSSHGWQIPAVAVRDKPRFPWRGLHLDVARHMFPVEFIKRYIDLMALHKLNTFHWHLTDDQGWRIEIRKYPRLTEVGSKRAATPYPARRDQSDGVPFGGYYTRAQIQSIVEYAASRHVTILPEIEMPGHALAALASFPELGCSGGPYQVACSWGIFEDVYCAGNQAVYRFLEDVLSEVIELFPGPYVHTGGDEVPRDRWKASPFAQARMKQEGLADEDELQSYFTKRVERFLNSRGLSLIHI